MQERESKSINASDISITKSTQLEYAIPASRIASLSAGEFVGFVADNPDQRIPQKIFHCELQNDHAALAKEEVDFGELPSIRVVSAEDIQENYLKIKADIRNLLANELTDATEDLEGNEEDEGTEQRAATVSM